MRSELIEIGDRIFFNAGTTILQIATSHQVGVARYSGEMGASAGISVCFRKDADIFISDAIDAGERKNIQKNAVHYIPCPKPSDTEGNT